MEGVVMDPAFWSGRKVLVTGHTGFKGGWLSLWLQEAGASVSGFSLDPPSDPSFFEMARVREGMRSIIGDLRDPAAVDAALETGQPEVVFHLAAQSLVRQSYTSPVETYATNVMGTLHLLEGIRRSPDVRAVVVVTTDKCYENREWPRPYRETDAMGGWDPYSSSKGSAELLCASYRRSFFNGESSRVALATARAGNVIGGGDYAADRLLPDLVRGALAGSPVVVRNPEAVRPWQHVLDSLSGYLLLARALLDEGQASAEGWNFGPAGDDGLTVAAVADEFVRGWGEGAAWRLDDGANPHEAQLLRLDSSKARARLDWRPRWNAGDALRRTIEWYRGSHVEGRDPRELAIACIADYG
jgi:CDP-glucose 4,6-dehydratase